MKQFVLNYLLPTLICLNYIIAEEVSGFSDLLSDSKYWPKQVVVHKEIVGETHGNIVPGGRRWEFIRYQDGKCRVDMGHNGIFHFEPGDTDFVERVQRNLKERTFPYQGLFTYRFTKSFYRPETLKGDQFGGDLEDMEYFVLVHFTYRKDDTQTQALGNFNRIFKDSLREQCEAAVLFLPTNNIIEEDIVTDYISDGFDSPTVVPFMREGMMHSLGLEIKTKGDVAVVDKNGAVLGQFFLADLGKNYDPKALFSVICKLIEPSKN